MHAPDPVLTASIYCNARLDRVVHQAVAPFLERLGALDPGAPWLAWWVRYSKNGDHLKLRLHGPAGRRDEARALLAETVEAFFAALPPAPEGEERVSRRTVPSIDAEDDAPADHPDRALLWTTYARSAVSFGPRQLLGDDAYVARITAALGRGAALVLEATTLGPDGAIPGSARQRALLKALVAGVGAAGFTPEERAEYLAYHRDWLLRFSVADSEKEAELLAGFDGQIAGMGATVAQLRRVAEGQWAPRAEEDDATTEGRLRAAVSALCTYAAPLGDDPGWNADPFTDRSTFPVLFKALHGVANQVGLNMPNEAFLHHLLLHAAGAAEPAAAGA